MTLYRLKFNNKNQKVFFSNVIRNDKNEWVYQGQGILFDLEHVQNEGEYYFLLLQEHAETIRPFESNIYYTAKKNIYEKNCSIFLYKDKCYSLNYINSFFLIPLENEPPEK